MEAPEDMNPPSPEWPHASIHHDPASCATCASTTEPRWELTEESKALLADIAAESYDLCCVEWTVDERLAAIEKAAVARADEQKRIAA